MKKLAFVFALLTSMASVTLAQQQPQAQLQPARKPPMRLMVTDFADGTIIPNEFSQASPDGGSSPELTWNTVPAGTQCFVLWMHDVDLALNHTSEDNMHWLVWNIPGTATSLPRKVPAGAKLPDGSAQISFAGPAYKGPGAPASGPLHHYVFELFALDIKLDDITGTNALEAKTNVFKAMQGHIIGKAAYTGLFKRPQ
jgi:Raf kinase inhibitor-like YbhB/YbcL family protein